MPVRQDGDTRPSWRIFGLTNLYAAGPGLLKRIFGTNYGYLAHKPVQPSLLDYCGPWPYYLVAMEVLMLGSLYLYYAPLTRKESS